MRILCVGLGGIARRHIANLKLLEPDCQIACWRQRPDPPEWVPPNVPVDRWLYDAIDVQAWRADAAIVANPASMHIDTARLLAGFRAHLFVEKPLSNSLAGTSTLIQTCANPRRPLVLMVAYDLRHYQPLIAVRDAIASGHIGRPLSIRCEVGQYLPEWRPGRDYRTSVSAKAALGGGVLLELSHEIDYARWLMGEVVSVSAMTGRLSDLEIDVEDTADILLRFQSGALGNIHLDMTDRFRTRRCRVVGTEGSIECNLHTGQTELFRAPSKWDVLCEGLTAIPDPLVEEMRHFLACCRGQAVPPVDGADAVRTLSVAIAAKRSAEEGREVEM